MSNNPSAVSEECNSPAIAQRKIVSEFTWAHSAASSRLNIWTGREQDEHHSALRERLTTIKRSISNVISVRVFMKFPFHNGVVRFALVFIAYLLNNLGLMSVGC
jgi:hypothetical protein